MWIHTAGATRSRDVDLVYAADAASSASLREPMESRHGTHTLDHAAALGLGSLEYEMIRLDS